MGVLRAAIDLQLAGVTTGAVSRVWYSADGTRHGEFRCLRLHVIPAALYTEAHKRAFFEPRAATLELLRRFNAPVKRLVAEWWSRIETSTKFADNREAVVAYQASLKPGDVTLIGLIAEGGQGMRTANNARFLGYLDGTPQADEIRRRRIAWTACWLKGSKTALLATPPWPNAPNPGPSNMA